MSFIILPIATMLIGFLLGVITTDSIGENKRYEKLEREIRRLKRRMQG